MRTELSRLLTACATLGPKRTQPFPPSIHQHISSLSARLTQPTHAPSCTFSTTPPLLSSHINRIHPSIRRPADFHTLLQSASSTNTLLLTLFKTSTCTSCSHITPLLSSLVTSRSCPSPGDKYASIAFAELELDSPERDDGGGSGWATMYDVGIEYGVRSVPTLIGFGGRRAERVTDRLADERVLRERARMEEWVDEVMRRGDPHPSQGGGLFARLFGGGSG